MKRIVYLTVYEIDQNGVGSETSKYELGVFHEEKPFQRFWELLTQISEFLKIV